MQHQNPTTATAQPQHRGSFFRPNRPGNLNIIDNVEVDLMNTCHTAPPYASQTYAYPNYSQQQQQQPQQPQSPYINNPPLSAPIHTQPANFTTPYPQQQQSYTPKYSPVASSAHIVNKQAQYFNFDMSQVPQPISAPSAQPQTQQMYHPQSPHVIASPRYVPSNQQQQQQPSQPPPQPSQQPQTQQQHQPNHYNNMPRTPTSALPYTTTQHNHHQHQINHTNSVSVPSSPIHHHMIQRPQQHQHSMFQFNTSLANSLQSTYNQQQQQQPNNYSPAHYTNSNGFGNGPVVDSVTASNDLMLADVVGSTDSYLVGADNDLDISSVDPLKTEEARDTPPSTAAPSVTTTPSVSRATGVNTTPGADTSHDDTANSTDDPSQLITTNTYGENDVDMVQEVINDMIQQEESINNKSSSLSSSSTSSILTDPGPTQPPNDLIIPNLDLVHEVAKTSPGGKIALGSSLKEAAAGLAAKKNSLDNLTSVANILLNTSLSEANAAKSTSPASSSCALTNLSEAAYLLNYVQQGEKPKSEPHVNHHSDAVSKASIHYNQQQQQQAVNHNSKLDLRKASSSEYSSSSSCASSFGGTHRAPEDDSSPPAKKPALPSKDILPKYTSAPAYDHLSLQQHHQQTHHLIQDEHQLIQNFNSGPGGVVIGPGGVQNCPECGKSFTNKSALAKHRLIHSNERKYACHLCDKSFKRQDHLNGHLQTHQDRKPFVCKAPGCDKSYCDSRSLKRHVESQHQDFLALLANGNQEALNFLPSIGKLKANIGPNIQQEIIVKSENEPGECSMPVIVNPASVVEDKIGASVQKPKNFFTFEEPKPEKCKICGKGFKNIPALNGHMRLHGGFLKTVKMGSKGGGISSECGDLMNSSMNNEDSISSNCSSNNSFSSAMSNNINSFPHSNQSSSTKSTSFKMANTMPMTSSSLYNNHMDDGSSRRMSGEDYSSMMNSNSILDDAANYMPAAKKASKVGSQNKLNMNQQPHNYRKPTTGYNIESMGLGHSQFNMIGMLSSLGQQSKNPFKKESFEDSAAASSQFASGQSNLTLNNLVEMANSVGKFPSGGGGQYGHGMHQFASYFGDGNPRGNSHHQHQHHQQQFSAPPPPPPPPPPSQSNLHLKNNKPFRMNKINDGLEYDSSGQLAAASTTGSSSAASSCSPPRFISDILQHQKQIQKQQFASQEIMYPSGMMAVSHNQKSGSPYGYTGGHVQQSSHAHHRSSDQESNAEVYYDEPENLSMGRNKASGSELNEDDRNKVPMSNPATNTNTLNQLSKHIHDITQLFNQAAAAAAAVASSNAAAAVAAAAAVNQIQMGGDSNGSNVSNQGSPPSMSAAAPGTSANSSAASKQKNKPMPLFIPSDISAFQQQQHKQQQLSQSMNANMFQRSMTHYPPGFYNHVYPHATLLKSPRLLNSIRDAQKPPQYTPPPMLSPFRKGPGLFYNPKQLSSLFPMPSPSQLTKQTPPAFNHSLSYSYIYPALLYNQLAAAYSSHHQQQQQQQSKEHEQSYESLSTNEHSHVDREPETSSPPCEKPEQVDEKPESEKENGDVSMKIIEDSMVPVKPAFKSRLLSQTSHNGPSNNSSTSFFPDENDPLSALIDCVEINANTKPFINVGDEFQAVLPELRREGETDREEQTAREDLMWSCDVLDYIDDGQLCHFLELVSKSSVVYGSSNNLELGLHLLNYFRGNVKLAIKALLDNSIELPVNHPISTYKYNETDVWTSAEIQKFEQAVFKHDKVFSEISLEMGGSKSVKQCIEFYYLWKKVMSDNARKKWRNFKKNRLLEDTDSIEQNLRSSATTTSDGSKTASATNDEPGKLNRDETTTPVNDDDPVENENGCSEEAVMSELDMNNNNLSAGKKSKRASIEDTSTSPTVSSGGRIQKQCDKCDMVIQPPTAPLT